MPIDLKLNTPSITNLTATPRLQGSATERAPVALTELVTLNGTTTYTGELPNGTPAGVYDFTSMQGATVLNVEGLNPKKQKKYT